MSEQISNNPVDQHIGRQLRMHRMGRGATQDELSRALEISADEYAEIETGTRRAKAAELLKLAELLDTQLVAFFSGELTLLSDTNAHFVVPTAGIYQTRH